MKVVCLHFNLVNCKFKPNDNERMVRFMKLLQNEVTEKDAYSECVYNNKGGDTKN